MANPCDADGTNPAFPMAFSTTSDAISTGNILTVWGDDGTGGNCGKDADQTCISMGTVASRAITFDDIRLFAAAVFGECAVTKPAEGTFTVLSQLEIGSSTATTTYVAASSSAIDFGAQLRIYASSTFTSGTLSATGSPFAGSTLSFSGAEVSAIGQGEFFSLFDAADVNDIPDGRIELFDSIVLHKTAGSTSSGAP